MSEPVLVDQARKLVKRIATGIKSKYGLSSMAVSIYDTAWVAMIQKKHPDGKQWLFPESFNYLLEKQGKDGGWDPLEQSKRAIPYPDTFWLPDCIIHSLAGLLALCRHQRFSSLHHDTDALKSRIARATEFLNQKLAVLNLEGVKHFGFELLVPVLLRLLTEEGMTFDFPAKEELLIRYETASSVDVSWLYNGEPCRVPLFSLEAFLGKLDFNRLGHLMTPTAGITASPASSAAYLIHSEVWSNEGEAYLRHVISHGQGGGNGSVGGIFPLEIFEPTWVLSTLLENGFTEDNLGREEVGFIVQRLHESLQDGVIGASACFFPDCDDTARTLTVLNSQGYRIQPSKMVESFEAKECFETFDNRLPHRVTSVSVNGNVLTGLLKSPDPESFVPQIAKVARFMCGAWRTPERLHDHWSMTEFYPVMHIAQSLVPLLIAYDRGSLRSLPPDLIGDDVPSCLQQILRYLLDEQHRDGSWGTLHSSEETAYAVIALAHLGSHLATVGVDELGVVDILIEHGKQYLRANRVPSNPNPDRVWTGKILHGNRNIGEAYVLGALKVNRLDLASARGSCPN